MSPAQFSLAGCPVCFSAEQPFVQAIDRARHVVEFVHLGQLN